MITPDIIRLLALPLFAWLAWRDHRTRRIPRHVWYPLLALGILVLAWDVARALTGPPFALRFLAIQVILSLGIIIPMAYGFHRFGGFGGADAKAFMIIALLFPTFPVFHIGSLTIPIHVPLVPVFSFTIILNGILIAAFYPFYLAARNAINTELSVVMFVGRPVDWSAIETTHGKLLETPTGYTIAGLDLDALRMYLRWRGLTLVDLRANPTDLRDPLSLPDHPNPPTDGAVARRDHNTRPDGGQPQDHWGADAFLNDIDHSAYGTTPTQLRDALDLLATTDTVWISPGIPFLVPLFAGLLTAFTFGDLLFWFLATLGVV